MKLAKLTEAELDDILTIKPALGAVNSPDVREFVTAKKGEAAISAAEVMARTRRAMAMNLPSAAILRRYTSPSREAVICGGGPSLSQDLDKVRALQARGLPVYTVNKTHDYLIENGITPYAHILLDPNPWVAEYTRPVKGVRYLIAGQCHDKTFEALKGFNVFLWHGLTDSEDGLKQPVGVLESEFKDREWVAHPGPTTVGLRAILVAQGIHKATHFHMFGMDSSRAPQTDIQHLTDQPGKLHAYEKKERADVPHKSVKMRATASGHEETFHTNLHMLMQCVEFESLVNDEMPKLAKQGKMPWTTFTFYGKGLLPSRVAIWGWHADPTMHKTWAEPRPANENGYTREYRAHLLTHTAHTR